MLRYLVMTIRTPHFQAAIIEPHKVFLERLRHSGNLELAGPFTDKSGGAYLIRAENLEAAKAIAFADPVHTSHSSIVSVYEWNAK